MTARNNSVEQEVGQRVLRCLEFSSLVTLAQNYKHLKEDEAILHQADIARQLCQQVEEAKGQIIKKMESHMQDMTGTLGNPKSNKFIVISEEVWQALKGGE